MTTLYQDHLTVLQQRYEAALTHFQCDAVVLASGHKQYYFQDDHTAPFHSYSGAQQWLPFTLSAETYLIIEAGKKPRIVWPIRDDFWHAPNPVPAGEWQDNWDITPARRDDKWFQGLPEKCAWLGPEPQDFAHVTPGFNTYVDFAKAVKTPYEIAAIQRASVRGAKGHLAARDAFLNGLSEFEIHLAYLQASQQTANQEPYPSIIGINEHASVLHYEHKDFDRSANPLTLLIDAGATEHGYASDITRTFTKQDDEFRALVKSLDSAEQEMAKKALSGTSYPELHQGALRTIAGILQDHKICSLSVDEQIAKGITQTFFPHGLGHLLGLQVHDVGGFHQDVLGTRREPDANAPFLRLTRTLEENMVLTIEPGLYFIPMLLDKMQAEIPQHGCDMSLIKQFIPYGGIRIEDNIVVKDEVSINLTRQAFSEYEV